MNRTEIFNQRKESMLEMWNNGYTKQQIADYHKISRQRVHQIMGAIGRQPLIPKPYIPKPKDRPFYKRESRELRREIINLLGGKCIKCGFTDIRALQLDHINGNGAKERREASAGKRFREILNLTDNERKTKYQILCANCNWIKRDENNEVYNWRVNL